MRFDRLDLTRYGRFTDASLPFGAAGADRPDLHIVYGDNEAGKTTTLNAMLDLLFGIDASTPYKFMHQAAALRLGGVLEVAGDRREVIRVPKAALLDSAERPLPEGVFNQELAGLDRATYRSMFSLDEKTLAAGGESILANHGDLGQLLFSATAGLADFGQALGKLRTETETFYKVHGRKHDLGDLKRQLASLRERRAEIDVMAAPFSRLVAARDAALSAYEAAAAERGRVQGELGAVRRHLVTLPRLVEWRKLQADVQEAAAVPSVPQGWPEEIVELRKDLVELGTRRAACEEEIDRLSKDIAALPVDDAALAVAARVRRATALRARDATAAKDLPDRRAALRSADRRVAEILLDLDRGDCETPRQLLLRPSVAKRLRESLEALSGKTSALEDARSELAKARSRREAAAAASESACTLRDDAPALFELKSAIASIESNDSASRLRVAARACREHADTLSERLAALAPWRGDADELAGLEHPDEAECDRMGRTLAEAQNRCERCIAEIDRLGEEVHRAGRAREALRADHAAIDDDAAAASRSARDEAWRAHLASLDGASAHAFEQALRADDAITGARSAQASALSELRAISRTRDLACAELELAERRLSAAKNELMDAEARTASRLGAFVDVASGTPPLAAFAAFLSKRERALDARKLLRGADAERESAMAEAAALRDRMAKALMAVGARPSAEESLETMMSVAKAFLEGQGAAGALRVHVDAMTREVDERIRRAQRAEQSLDAWSAAWAETLRATWLDGCRDVALVRDALDALADLGPALDVRDGLADRVEKMEADRRAFAAEVGEVADALGIPRGGDVGALADRIEARTGIAERDAASLAMKADDRQRAQQRLAELRPAIEATERRTAEMTSRFAVADLDDLALAFEASRRQAETRSRIQALEIEICGACNTRSVMEADAALSTLDREALERGHAELEARCANQIERTQELFAALGRAQDAVAAVAGDEAAARLEADRRAILLDIEDRTMAHLAMRAGIIAAEGAIELYRERHRSSMMKQASELFSALSRGAYKGLAAQSTKDSEVLVGLPADGGSKLSAEMSTATRNQLYLALRIAAYREFVKTRTPVPFVLDDVLETFDDDRAEASLTLLAEMAKTGQVIYLTHHKHLRAIARRVCPDARLHDLGGLR